MKRAGAFPLIALIATAALALFGICVHQIGRLLDARELAHTASGLRLDELADIAFALAWGLLPWLVLALGAVAATAVALYRAGLRDANAPTPDERPMAPGRSAPPTATMQPSAARRDSEMFALRLLSEVDRAILSGASNDRVIDLLLRAAPKVMGCESVMVTVLDRESISQGTVFVHNAGSLQQRALALGERDCVILRELAVALDGRLLDPKAPTPLLQPLACRAARSLLLVPVFVDANLAAVLGAAFTDSTGPEPAARALARDCANRLGVTLTTQARATDLYQETHYDPITALPNQRFMWERLGQEMSRAQREAVDFAVMYVDLDRFRKVNESVGHQAGDSVLEQASMRMRRCMRQEDVVARFSGDEFVVMLPTVSTISNVARIAEKLIAALSEPFTTGTDKHFLGASIGVSMFPQDGRTADKLVRNAHFAMYRAKAAGRGQCVFFDERMNTQALDRTGLERDLRAAVDNGELSLVYQPQVDLRNGKIVGTEALARWNHSRRGPIPPSVFVAIAEESNLIEGLGRLVRETACAQYQVWQRAGLVLPRIAVNVSSREVRHFNFLDEIRGLVQRHGMRPFSLELEITESLFLDDSTDVMATLRGLHDMGIYLSIDDFGTGYSSMAYLKNLPFDVLKIDRSFIKDLGSGDGSEGVVNAILGVARSLGKDVIAEGVETELQRNFLLGGGCDAAQGYLWSRPLPPEEFEQLISNWIIVPQPTPVFMPLDSVPDLTAALAR